VVDYGARLITAVASVIDSNDPQEIERILDGIPDPAGMFYRFNLPGSILGHSKTAWTNAKQ
jgi:F420-non-reducing hydrogenase small subunit